MIEITTQLLLPLLVLAARNARAYHDASHPGALRARLEDFGGVADGPNGADNTQAFARAVAFIVRNRRANDTIGAVLYVGPGIYATGPFNLTSHMTLQLRANTTIVARPELCAHALASNTTCAGWPQLPPLANYGLDADIGAASRYQSFIHAQDVISLNIAGHPDGTSVIQGGGKPWWSAHMRNHQSGIGRPHLVEILRGRHFRMNDVVLQDSPFWTLHPVAILGVSIKRIRIETPLQGAPNTDGFDPDACRDVTISDSVIRSNDDCIAIKSGLDCFGRIYGPCEHVVVRNVTCVNAIVVGSEMSGGVRNVSVRNSTGRIYIKTGARRGGFLEQIEVDNVVVPSMTASLGLPPQKFGIRVTTGYDAKPTRCGQNWDPPPTFVHGLTFRRVYGAPDLVLQNWSIDVDATGANVTGMLMEDIRLPEANSGLGTSCQTSGTVIEGEAEDVVPSPKECPGLRVRR